MAKEFSEIPVLVKHVALAIFNKRGVKGPKAFEAAMEIALAHLKDSGYLSAATLKPLNIRLTGKGQQRNRLHLRESRHKSLSFDRLFEQYQMKMAAGKPARETETEKLPGGRRE